MSRTRRRQKVRRSRFASPPVATVRLGHPIRVRGEELQDVAFRRPRYADAIRLARMPEAEAHARALALVRACTGLRPSELDQVPLEDLTNLINAAADVLEHDPRWRS